MADQTASRKKSEPKKSAESNGSPQKGRPSRPLPTNRIARPRQFDILRAYAIASGDEHKPVRNSDVAEISTFAANTLSQANAFFVSAGFLSRTTEGFVPAEAVFDFEHDFKWSPETAAHKLAPALEETWFAEALIPRLQFRDITETEAFAILSSEAGVGPEYREQLEILLEYLQAANLINWSNGMVTLVHHDPLDTPAFHRGASRQNGNGAKPRHEATASPAAAPPKPPEPARPRNAFDFSVSFNVSMDELHDWSADRIAAFFNGVATVINAKKGTGEKSPE